MKKENVAEILDQITPGLSPDDWILQVATIAAQMEREACAKEIESLHIEGRDFIYMAAALRTRGLKP